MSTENGLPPLINLTESLHSTSAKVYKIRHTQCLLGSMTPCLMISPWISACCWAWGCRRIWLSCVFIHYHFDILRNKWLDYQERSEDLTTVRKLVYKSWMGNEYLFTSTNSHKSISELLIYLSTRKMITDNLFLWFINEKKIPFISFQTVNITNNRDWTKTVCCSGSLSHTRPGRGPHCWQLCWLNERPSVENFSMGDTCLYDSHLTGGLADPLRSSHKTGAYKGRVNLILISISLIARVVVVTAN